MQPVCITLCVKRSGHSLKFQIHEASYTSLTRVYRNILHQSAFARLPISSKKRGYIPSDCSKKPRTPSSAVACETCSGINVDSDRNVYKEKAQKVGVVTTAGRSCYFEDDSHPNQLTDMCDPTEAFRRGLRHRRKVRRLQCDSNATPRHGKCNSPTTSEMRLPLRGEGRRRTHVLRRLWGAVFGGLRGRRMCLEDDVQVVVAAHNHMFPLGYSRQTDVGNRRLGGDLVSVLIPLLRQVEILLVDVHTTGATRDGLFGDAHKRQVGVCFCSMLDC